MAKYTADELKAIKDFFEKYKAGIKDTEFVQTSSVNAEDIIAIVQDGTNKKVTVEDLKEYLNGNSSTYNEQRVQLTVMDILRNKLKRVQGKSLIIDGTETNIQITTGGNGVTNILGGTKFMYCSADSTPVIPSENPQIWFNDKSTSSKWIAVGNLKSETASDLSDYDWAVIPLVPVINNTPLDPDDPNSGIKSITVKYIQRASSSQPEFSDPEWDTVMPEPDPGHYLFTWTRYIYVDIDGMEKNFDIVIPSYIAVNGTSTPGKDAYSTFKSTVFTRIPEGVDISKLSAPTGGSFNNPIPDALKLNGKTYDWTDGVSDNEGILIMTSAFFTNDTAHLEPYYFKGNQKIEGKWSPITIAADAVDIDFEFSSVPEDEIDNTSGTPMYNGKPFNPEGCEEFDGVWYNNALSGSVWMAVRRFQYNKWGAWDVTLIKGEKGAKGDKGDKGDQGNPGKDGVKGTTIKYRGEKSSTADLSSVSNPQEGDAWLIDGNLWAYLYNPDTLSWVNIGDIQGPAGESFTTELHTAWATGITYKSDNTTIESVEGFVRNSDVVDKLVKYTYMGTYLKIYTDVLKDTLGNPIPHEDPNDPKLYTWRNIQGADGKTGYNGGTSITSTVFVRSEDNISTPPATGSFDSPIPTKTTDYQVDWQDGIPEGHGPVYSTTAIFFKYATEKEALDGMGYGPWHNEKQPDGTYKLVKGWSIPVLEADAPDMDVAYSDAPALRTPKTDDKGVVETDASGNIIYEESPVYKNGRYEYKGKEFAPLSDNDRTDQGNKLDDDPYWYNEAKEGSNWKAVRYYDGVTGTWGKWNIELIKGEVGKTLYSHIAWAKATYNPDGTLQLDKDNNPVLNRKTFKKSAAVAAAQSFDFLGTAITDRINDPDDIDDYTWVFIKGDTGVGTPGKGVVTHIVWCNGQPADVTINDTSIRYSEFSTTDIVDGVKRTYQWMGIYVHTEGAGHDESTEKDPVPYYTGSNGNITGWKSDWDDPYTWIRAQVSIRYDEDGHLLINGRDYGSIKGDPGASLIFVGNWKENVNYEGNSQYKNIVFHEDKYYIAVKDNVNIEPGVASDWSTYWDTFDSQFSSIATGLLYSTKIYSDFLQSFFARFGDTDFLSENDLNEMLEEGGGMAAGFGRFANLIADKITANLVTAKKLQTAESGARIVTEGNDLKAYSNNGLSTLVTGDTFSNSKVLLGNLPDSLSVQRNSSDTVYFDLTLDKDDVAGDPAYQGVSNGVVITIPDLYAYASLPNGTFTVTYSISVDGDPEECIKTFKYNSVIDGIATAKYYRIAGFDYDISSAITSEELFFTNIRVYIKIDGVFINYAVKPFADKGIYMYSNPNITALSKNGLHILASTVGTDIDSDGIKLRHNKNSISIADSISIANTSLYENNKTAIDISNSSITQTCLGATVTQTPSGVVVKSDPTTVNVLNGRVLITQGDVTIDTWGSAGKNYINLQVSGMQGSIGTAGAVLGFNVNLTDIADISDGSSCGTSTGLIVKGDGVYVTTGGRWRKISMA